MEIFSQIIGWAGALLVVTAYLLVSYKKLEPTSRLYQLMNLAGAIGVGINAAYQQAWPSFGIQAIWFTIAILALTKNWTK